MADSLEASVASLHAQSGRRRGSRTVDPQDSWGRSAQADACADDLVGTRSLRATLVEQQRKEPEFRSTIGRQQQDWEALTFRLDSAERPLGSIESSPAWAVAGRVTLARSRPMRSEPSGSLLGDGLQTHRHPAVANGACVYHAQSRGYLEDRRALIASKPGSPRTGRMTTKRSSRQSMSFDRIASSRRSALAVERC